MAQRSSYSTWLVLIAAATLQVSGFTIDIAAEQREIAIQLSEVICEVEKDCEFVFAVDEESNLNYEEGMTVRRRPECHCVERKCIASFWQPSTRQNVVKPCEHRSPYFYETTTPNYEDRDDDFSFDLPAPGRRVVTQYYQGVNKPDNSYTNTFASSEVSIEMSLSAGD